MADSFLADVDTGRVDSLMESTKSNVQYFNSTCSSIISEYSGPLDDLMKDIYVDCVKNEDPSLAVHERY